MQAPQIGVDDLRPFIDGFLQRLTRTQYQQLRDGRADNATNLMMADMLLELITFTSDSIVANVSDRTKKISEEYVEYELGNTVPEAFAQALYVDAKDPDIDSEGFNKMMSAQVTRCVNSALGMSSHMSSFSSFDEVCLSDTLNYMIKHTSSMLKSVMHKMTSFLCKLSPSSEDPIIINPDDDYDEDDDVGDADDEYSDDDDDDDRDLSMAVNIGSIDSTASKISEVQSILSKEMGSIIDVFLGDACDSELDVLLSDSSHSSDSVANEISELTGSEEEYTESFQLKSKIRTCLVKQYMKQAIHRTARQLRKSFSSNSDGVSRESLQAFADNVDRLLWPQGGEKQQVGKHLSELTRLQNISDGKDPAFRKALSDLLYLYITEGISRESLGPQTRDNIRDVIDRKEKHFQVLLRWWAVTQADIHCDNIIRALKNMEPASPPPAATETGREPVPCVTPEQDLETEKKKLSVLILVERVVMRTFKKAKVNSSFRDPCTIIDKLFKKIWAVVEGVDFEITPETLKSMHKAIFKDLCQYRGCAELVMVSMVLGGPEADQIAGTFKQHLIAPPKKPNAICRFFISLGKSISKPFT